MKLSKAMGEALYELFGPNGCDQTVTIHQKHRMEAYRELERHGVVRIEGVPRSEYSAVLRRVVRVVKTLCETLAKYQPSDGPTFTKIVGDDRNEESAKATMKTMNILAIACSPGGERYLPESKQFATLPNPGQGSVTLRVEGPGAGFTDLTFSSDGHLEAVGNTPFVTDAELADKLHSLNSIGPL